MTTLLPIATTDTDTARHNTSLPCVDKQLETGEPLICLRHHKPHRTSLSGKVVSPAGVSDSSEVSSPDQETVPPLPLDIVIPEDHLPDILDVHDTDTFRRATSFNVPSYKRIGDDVWNSWEKFLARLPYQIYAGGKHSQYD